jgi:hypothetical protein
VFMTKGTYPWSSVIQIIVNLLVSKGKTLNKNILQMLNKSFSNTNFNTNFIYKIIRQLNVY